jgi:hypothetical protein
MMSGSDSFELGEEIQESNVEGNNFPIMKDILKANDNHYFRHHDIALSNPNTNAMLIEDALHRRSSNMDILDSDKNLADILDEGLNPKLKDKLVKANRTIQKQQEDYKAQVLHIETISMMTKYQLVFIKMEASLIKMAHTIRTRENFNLASTFATINSFSRAMKLIKQYKTTLIYQGLKTKLETLIRALTKLKRKAVSKSFNQLLTKHKLYRMEKKFREEKDKVVATFHDTMNGKDKEIATLMKKVSEANNALFVTKTKESELSTKLKIKEKIVHQLESERNDLVKQKRMSPIDGHEERHLEQKLRDIQLENEELRDKLSNTECNVGNFIKEMSDLLDTHELSTNVGSEENNSFFASQHQEFGLYDDEMENLSSKAKEKAPPQSGAGSSKPNSKDKDAILKHQSSQQESIKNSQRTTNSSSNNTGRYAKTYQIN